MCDIQKEVNDAIDGLLLGEVYSQNGPIARPAFDEKFAFVF